MKQKFIRIDDWYYPMQGIMYRINSDDESRKSICLFEVGSTSETALAIYTGEQATELIELLDDLAFDITTQEG